MMYQYNEIPIADLTLFSKQLDDCLYIDNMKVDSKNKLIYLESTASYEINNNSLLHEKMGLIQNDIFYEFIPRETYKNPLLRTFSGVKFEALNTEYVDTLLHLTFIYSYEKSSGFYKECPYEDFSKIVLKNRDE